MGALGDDVLDVREHVRVGGLALDLEGLLDFLEELQVVLLGPLL